MTEADRIAKETRQILTGEITPRQQRVANLAIDFAAHLVNLLERLVVAREKEVDLGKTPH